MIEDAILIPTVEAWNKYFSLALAFALIQFTRKRKRKRKEMKIFHFLRQRLRLRLRRSCEPAFNFYTSLSICN